MDFPEVQSREDFFKFLDELIYDFRESSDSWENVTVPDFLEAISAWTKDRDASASADAWRLAAQILYAGSRYE
jgi:hypothetical protein